MNHRIKITGWILLLVIIDMVIKIVIDTFYLETRFDILPPFFYFQPVFNIHYSWVASLLKIKTDFLFYLIFILLLGVCMGFIWDFFFSLDLKKKKLLTIAVIFGIAGYICAIFSNLFWIGCLDYIYLKPFFVFDLKDLYMNVCLILFLTFYFINRKNPELNRSGALKLHIKNRLKSFRNKF